MALHLNFNTVATFALVISIPALVIATAVVVAIVRRGQAALVTVRVPSGYISTMHPPALFLGGTS